MSIKSRLKKLADSLKATKQANTTDVSKDTHADSLLDDLDELFKRLFEAKASNTSRPTRLRIPEGEVVLITLLHASLTKQDLQKYAAEKRLRQLLPVTADKKIRMRVFGPSHVASSNLTPAVLQTLYVLEVKADERQAAR